MVGLVDEFLAAFVFEEMIVSLHVWKVERRVTIAFQVGKSGIARPTVHLQSHLGGHIPELPMPEFLVEYGMFESVGMKVAAKASASPM